MANDPMILALITALCGACVVLVHLAWANYRKAVQWQVTAQCWFDRYRLAVRIPDPKRVLRDIFAPVAPSQIGISLPDATTDSEAAREVLALTIGEREIEE